MQIIKKDYGYFAVVFFTKFFLSIIKEEDMASKTKNTKTAAKKNDEIDVSNVNLHDKPIEEYDNKKLQELETNRENSQGEFLTTNQGVRVNDNQNSLKAGERGATLLEDFILREKITHFDHERIPERVVHARGAGAHGYFQIYESMEKYTKAKFLNDPSRCSPGPQAAARSRPARGA